MEKTSDMTFVEVKQDRFLFLFFFTDNEILK